MAEKLVRDDQPCELEYVGFWPRALAGIIDLGLVAALVFPLVQAAEGGPAVFLEPAGTGQISLLLGLLAALLFYLAPGTTPGKLAISAVVVDERTCCPPGMPQRIGRSFGVLLSLVPLGFGFLWVAFHPKKQGWHDKLAGTLVVRERRARWHGAARRASASARQGEHEATAIPRH